MSIAPSNLEQDFAPEENEQEEQARKRQPSGRAIRWVKRALIGIPTAIVLLILLVNGANIAVELLWFGSLGIPDVFLTILKTQLLLFFGGGALFFAAFFLSTTLAYRLAQRRWAAWGRAGDIETAGRRTPPALVLVAILALGGLIALWLGATLSGQWDPALRLPHRTDMGIADPIHGRDVSYYLFVLPVLLIAKSWLLVAAIIILVVTAVVYFIWLIMPQTRGQREEGRGMVLRVGRPIQVHLSLLAAVPMAMLAWHQALSLDQLVYAGRGATLGATFADVNVLAPALWLGIIVAALGAVGLVAGAFVRLLWVGPAALGLWALVWLFGQTMLPAVVHRFVVLPAELETERPYIEHNMTFTRQAYGLDKVKETDYPAQDAVTREEIEANAVTLRNVRLWDSLPSLATYNQIQSIRLYYNFLGSDFDRYHLDNEYRQVIISARELVPENLDAAAQTFVNRRLKFTHGYGVVISPVNEVTPEGLPELFVQDVPPKGKLSITRPEIYYGEWAGDWVLTKTDTPEFDYPRGESNVETIYAGESGVAIGSFWRRLLFAWYLGDINLLISRHVQPDTTLLFRRNILERLLRVAPFLLPDPDPYIVAHDGGLYWIQDAYTASTFYPYSQPSPLGVNYIRNSVKIVTNAYDGSVQYYIADDSDPLIRAYAQAFPGLFQPLSAMPQGLRAHIRYPQGIFSVQSIMYRLYHVKDVQAFYNREDLLAIPAEVRGDTQRPVEPYYVIMRLPGEQREEFVLLLPYTPNNKNNMSNWLAARSDGAHYGELVAYKYPKDKLIFGPLQIEARIDQNEAISQQFTLWNQSGSRVIRGNMLVIPIGQSNLYVEPIYLLADQGSIPEMKRVIMATGNSIVMEQTVSEALAQLFGGPVNLGPTTTAPAPATTAQPTQTTPAAQQTQTAPAPQPTTPAATPGLDRGAVLAAVEAVQDRANRLQRTLLELPADVQRQLGDLDRELSELRLEIFRLRQALETGS